MIAASLASCRKKSPADEAGLRFEGQGADGTLYYDKRADAEVFLPAGYQIVPPVPNRQVVYDFGMKHEKDPFEVRVRFDPPLGPSPEQRRECEEKNKKEPGSCEMVGMDPEVPSPAWALSMQMNLSQNFDAESLLRDFRFFPPKAVKNEFGADWGVSGPPFEIKDPDFAGPFKYCQLVQVHKNGIGSYSIFQLYNSVEDYLKLHQGAFYVVKFRQKEADSSVKEGK